MSRPEPRQPRWLCVCESSKAPGMAKEFELTDAMPANGPREFYLPVFLEHSKVRPLFWKGSADVFTLARANALLVRAENEPALAEGARVRVLTL